VGGAKRGAIRDIISSVVEKSAFEDVVGIGRR
jgi:hypothetical protein